MGDIDEEKIKTKKQNAEDTDFVYRSIIIGGGAAGFTQAPTHQQIKRRHRANLPDWSWNVRNNRERSCSSPEPDSVI